MAFFNEEYAARVTVEAIRNTLAEELRKQFEEEARPIIDAAVKKAMVLFEPVVARYRDELHMKDVVEVIVKDARAREK